MESCSRISFPQQEVVNIPGIKLERYRWKIYLLLSFSFLIAFFHRYAIGVISNMLGSDLELTATQLGTISSLYYYAYGILQVPVGVLTDKFGVRKITTAGMASITLGSLFFALASGRPLAYSGRLLIGIGSAVFFISTLKTISVWFPPGAYTKLLGWTSLIGNTGALLAATPYSLLVGLTGWRTSYLLFAAIAGVMMVSIWLIVRDSPRDLGLDPEFEVEEDERSFGQIAAGIKRMAGTMQFWLYFFIASALMGSFMSLSGLWLVPYMMHVYDFTRNAAANLVVVVTLGMLIGSALLGWAESKIGSRVKMIRIAVIFNLLVWTYIIVLEGAQPPFAILLGILFALGIVGMFILTSFTNVKMMFPDLKGSATGVINIAPFLGTIIFNFLIGWRLDASWTGGMMESSRVYTLQGYQQGFGIVLFFSAIALLLSFKLESLEK